MECFKLLAERFVFYFVLSLSETCLIVGQWRHMNDFHLSSCDFCIATCKSEAVILGYTDCFSSFWKA